MTRLFVAVFLFLGVVSVSLRAVEPDYVEGQFIVKLPGDSSLDSARGILNSNQFTVMEALVPSIGLYLVKIKTNMPATAAVQRMNLSNAVEYAQLDHKLTLRDKLPNDGEFDKQWSLYNQTKLGADISAPQAWSLGIGGMDGNGHDIVVAIVDGGMDINHTDLKPNVWVNKGETAGNGIDDDGNGYIDDKQGWNAYSNNGNIPAARHGTHVGGIIGARGDNGTQVVGVNWEVKLMAVAGSSASTSTVTRAYNYVMTQKRIFLDTNGTKGANVIATNNSFGIDGADCNSAAYKAWNDLYNAMGALGILSAAATANRAWDIDVKGDVPTGCQSPYVISVTNTTKDDVKYNSAAWGKTTIDLGAPGTAIHSTVPNNGTGPMTGTSMATPHVAGAIAFLYSVGSMELAKLTKSDPAKAALAVKAMLLNTVDSLPSLEGKTVSGGRLNLARAGQAANRFK